MTAVEKVFKAYDVRGIYGGEIPYFAGNGDCLARLVDFLVRRDAEGRIPLGHEEGVFGRGNRLSCAGGNGSLEIIFPPMSKDADGIVQVEYALLRQIDGNVALPEDVTLTALIGDCHILEQRGNSAISCRKCCFNLDPAPFRTV